MTAGTQLLGGSRVQQAWTFAKGLQCLQRTHCRGKKQTQRRERVETTAVVQGKMVERWEHADRDCVFACDMR